MNLRPPAPKAGALAKLRYTPKQVYYIVYQMISQQNGYPSLFLWETDNTIIIKNERKIKYPIEKSDELFKMVMINDNLNHFFQGNGTVTDLIFNMITELGKGKLITMGNENRIISKSGMSLR